MAWMLVGAALFAIIYIGGAVFFSFHYYPGTTINGLGCSLKTISGAEDIIAKQAGGYVLQIEGRNGMETVSAEDISLRAEFDDSVVRLMKEQNQFLWIFGILQKHAYEIDTLASYDEAALEAKMEGMSILDASNMQPPENAYIGEFNGQSYDIVPEVPGTTLDVNKTKAQIRDAVDSLQSTLVLAEAGCYMEPAVTSSDEQLVGLSEGMNKYAGASITYEFGEDKEVVDGAVIKDWLTLSGNKISVDAGLAREYVNSVARKYETFGRPRDFKKTDGETIHIKEGAYGWWIDRAATTEALVAAVENGETLVTEPIYRATAAQHGENDIGNTYVEIDLTKQHLYFYKEGSLLIESDFVSGSVNKGFATPVGVYGLTYKERDATLRGENYATPVKYWMPFNGNVGMHDADWRKSFGGEIYVTNGSHGCVNLPPENARVIYENIEKGIPVIVYGGYVKKEPTEEELAAQAEQEAQAALEAQQAEQEALMQQLLQQQLLQQQLEQMQQQQQIPQDTPAQ